MLYRFSNFAVDLDVVAGNGTDPQSSSGTLVIERPPTPQEYIFALAGVLIFTGVVVSTLGPSVFPWMSQAMRPFALPAIGALSGVSALFCLATRRFEIRRGLLRSQICLFGFTWSRDVAVSSAGVRVVGRLTLGSETEEAKPIFEPEVHVGDRWMSLGRSVSIDTALAFAGRIAEAAGVPMIGLAEP